MNFSKEWPKVVLEVAVVLFLVVVGIAMISKIGINERNGDITPVTLLAVAARLRIHQNL